MRQARLTKLTAAVVIAVGLSGCGEKIDPLRIGSKEFTESHLLAEMLALMAEQEGIPVARSIPYGDAFVNFEGIKQGQLDLYPEYNGTGLVFLGQVPLTDGDASTATVKELFKPLGLEWKERFGFANDYAFVMRPDQADVLGVRTLSNLSKLSAGFRFASDKNFTERPLDGLGAMIRRYGLVNVQSLPFLLKEDGKAKIFQAVLDGQADVAEVYATDGQIAEYGLKVLEDDLKFFPVYQAAPLVRSDALARFPNLSGALQKLAGQISADDMRKMNAAVDLDGRSYQEVARAFLTGKGLLPEGGAIAGAEELQISAGSLDEVAGTAGRALRAVRTAYPGRSVKVKRSSNPVMDVAKGKSRLALVSAEAFYRIEGDTAVRSVPAEALGVVGYRTAHIVTLRDSGPGSFSEMTNIGVGELNGASHRAAKMVATSLGLSGKVNLIGDIYGSVDSQIAALERGSLDGLFLMVPIGHEAIDKIMKDDAFDLIALDEWTNGNNAIRFSFLRPSKIPAGSYKGQPAALESINAQMVLAGPTSVAEQLGGRGPGTAGTADTQPLPAGTIAKLNTALGADELVDPALPIALSLRPTIESGLTAIEADVSISATNLIVIAILVYLFYLFIRKEPKVRRQQ